MVNETPVLELLEEHCQHYWVIQEPAGTTLSGICNRCGKQRNFNRDATVLEEPPKFRPVRKAAPVANAPS